MAAPRIICMGAAHVDILARALAPIIEGSSNPVRTTQTRGGVACNVAVWLAHIGASVSLISRIGDDAAGDAVVAELDALGIDRSGLSRSATCPTASYTAALDPAGDLHIGLADMAIYDEITPTMVDLALETTDPADAWFIDTNLPTDVIRHIANRAPASVILAGDTVSAAKASRIRAACPRLDLLVTNDAEMAAILDDTEARNFIADLRDMGPDRVLIGRAEDGVKVMDQASESDHPSMASTITDVTGAGDALAAGALYGITTGYPMDIAVRIGLAAAAWSVGSPTPVPVGVTIGALLDRASITR
jgi:pseudouridine kinase